VLGDPQVFLLFAALATAIFWSIPFEFSRVRALLLLALSFVLVAAIAPLSLVVALSMAAIAWVASRRYRPTSPRWTLWVPVSSIVALLALVSIPESMKLGGAPANVSLGISYVAFRAISVVVDGFNERKKETARPQLVQLLLFCTFFPTYSAGPIDRAATFAKDRLAARFDARLLVSGCERILLGLFKTVFLGAILDRFLETRFPGFFQNVSSFSVIEAHLYSWLSLLSIYLNFSGASDVAIGAGRLVGIQIVENFDHPFLAQNIQEFWKRWHISMTNFAFRYIYFPLIQRTKGNVPLSLFVSFVLIGLWHRLDWRFVIWGVAHGAALAGYAIYSRRTKDDQRFERLRSRRFYRIAAWCVTQAFVASIWTFAIATDLRSGLRFASRLVGL
jgi:D-alanyl-lipoteichoic acid acyltransferase DltB (MBOAT superfamily)